LGRISTSPNVFLKDLCGGFEEQITGGPLVGAGALHHENGHHSVGRVHRQISAIGTVQERQGDALRLLVSDTRRVTLEIRLDTKVRTTFIDGLLK
jgi:hypothetical protein